MRAPLPLTLAALAAASCASSTSPAPVAGNGGATHASTAVRRGGSTSGGGSGGSSSASGSPADAGAGSSGGSSGSASGGTTSASSSSAPAGGSTGSSGGSSGAPAVCGSDIPDGGGNGTNKDFNCDLIPYYDGGAGDCPGDWLGTTVADFETCTPICGASVQAVTPEGVPIAGTNVISDPVTGVFHFCLPSPQPFLAQVSATGYPDFYWGEIDGQAGVDLPLFGMLSIVELQTVGAFLQPTLSLQQGALLAELFESQTCGFAYPRQGWTMWLTDEDGGLYPDGGYTLQYIDETGFPNPGLTATTEAGTALFYDIDPSVATLPSLHSLAPDGGGCEVRTGLGFTGRFLTGAGVFSEIQLFLGP